MFGMEDFSKQVQDPFHFIQWDAVRKSLHRDPFSGGDWGEGQRVTTKGKAFREAVFHEGGTGEKDT